MSACLLAPVCLKTNNFVNPIGIPLRTPDFSWQLEGPDGARQTAWHIRVTSDGCSVWDSGWQDGGEECVVGPQRGLLRSRTAYAWQLQVRDSAGAESAWSAEAAFETGLDCEADWQGATWVGQPAEFSGHALCFRRLFEVKEHTPKARLYISGLGWSEAWLNGVRLGGDAILQPPQTDYSKSYSVLTYDISGLLKEGVNSLAVHVGCGWHGGIRLRYLLTDGDTLLDLSSPYHLPKVYGSPVCRHSVFDGEEYDARREYASNWKAPDGPGVPGHRPAFRVYGPAGQPRGFEEEPIRPQCELPVVEWRKLDGEGHYVADFGRNFAGWCRLKLEAVAAGTRVALRHTEILRADGTVNWDNLLDAEPEDIYIARGLPEGESFEPHFTYHGFRFVEILGLPYAPKADTLTGIHFRNDCRPAGNFSCSNEILNNIWQLVRNTESNNIHAVPTDCPQRNERMGWLNDMMARCETALYLFDESNVHTKWLRDIVEAQDPVTGEVPMTAPFYWGFTTDPVCSSFVEAAYLDYAFYGKRAQLEELYPAMRKWIDRMASLRAPEDGIFRPAGPVGDWVPPLAFNNGHQSAQNFTVPPELVSTCVMHYATRILLKIAGILGKADECRALEALAAQMQADFLKAYRNAPGRLSTESQSSYAFALYCGLFPEAERQAAADRLAELFRANNCKHSTGNIGTKYLLETLTEYGYGELAYTLVASDDYPGWGYMLAHGATALWERWELTENDGMNSHDHPMLGCPGVWLMRHCAGIQIADGACGFNRFRLAPIFFEKLDYAGADFDSRAGMVRSHWHRDTDGTVLYDFQIPAGCQAEVILPDGSSQLFDSGCHQLRYTVR